MLIPKEFGGGFIKDNYQGYGDLGHKEDGSPKYDIYELLAFWNAAMVVDRSNSNPIQVKTYLKYDEGGSFPYMKEVDKYTPYNRNIGIRIGSYDHQMDHLMYPLKLVSASFRGTYEDCEGVSYIDPDQGFHPTYR